MNSKPHPYKTYSHQLEMNYPIFSDESNQETAPQNLSASAGKVITDAVAPVADSRFEPNKTEKKEAIISKNEITKSEKIKAYSQKFGDISGTKKIEKLLKKQNKQTVDAGQLITGIILGILGLILLAIAGATGAPVLVYVAGVVLFIAGVILILIGAF